MSDDMAGQLKALSDETSRKWFVGYVPAAEDRPWACQMDSGREFCRCAATPEKAVQLAYDAVVRSNTCQWTHDTDTYSWDGSCGVKWVFTADGPVENEVKFCPGCGQRVEVSE